jgi:hypothetical protein
MFDCERGVLRVGDELPDGFRAPAKLRYQLPVSSARIDPMRVRVGGEGFDDREGLRQRGGTAWEARGGDDADEGAGHQGSQAERLSGSHERFQTSPEVAVVLLILAVRVD